jgi:oligopeptide/dipeptide ABC transporter ATP-binding protein
VDDVTLEIKAGETLGIVGETGCGKSTLGRAILGLAPLAAGQILIDGKPLPRRSRPGAAASSLGLQMVFQDPAGSLNPRRTVELSIGEAIHNDRVGTVELRGRIAELLDDVALPQALASRYPHELSGGQQQRVAIARALGSQPRLIVLDEAVSALDTSTQAQILNLLLDLRERHGLTYIFISHDIEVVRFMSTRIAVMYLGKVVEIGVAATVVARALHPYSICLASAVPYPDPRRERLRVQHVLSGTMPSALAVPSGCPFHSRCPVAQFPICSDAEPQLLEYQTGNRAACHFAGRFDELVGVSPQGSAPLISGAD